MSHDIAYLERSFARLRDDAVQSAQKERLRVTAEATRAGAPQSGRMLLLVKEQYDRAATNAADKIVHLAYELTGATDKPVSEAVELGLSALAEGLAADLADFLESQRGWVPPNVRMQLNNDFLDRTNKLIDATVDDFQRGIAEGTRLTKEPLVSVISEITNNPGAMLQTGVGNRQNAITTITTDNIKAALAQFLHSKEVEGLGAENKQSIVDMVEIVANELDKPSPDASKIARWGKRLIVLAERLGVAAAASVLSKMLFPG
jgi:ferritin-like metal-binding protein YciE